MRIRPLLPWLWAVPPLLWAIALSTENSVMGMPIALGVLALLTVQIVEFERED